MKIQTNKNKFVIDNNVSLEKAKFVIIPVPYEQTTSYGKGTKKGPDEVIKASPQIELWDEELGFDTYKTGIFTAESFKHVSNEKDFFKNIEKYVENLINSYSAFPVFIGGEHSITQGLIPPFKKKYNNFSVLHFDAHADLRSKYEGTSHSHASALYPLAQSGTKLVQIGIRSVASDEKYMTEKPNVKTFLIHENLDFKKLRKRVIDELSDNVYMTVDIDGFDPSVMPATGTPQPGGFMWYDALDMFREVIYKKNVVGIDVVETSPVKEFHITEFNVAKLIYRLIGYISKKKGYIRVKQKN